MSLETHYLLRVNDWPTEYLGLNSMQGGRKVRWSRAQLARVPGVGDNIGLIAYGSIASSCFSFAYCMENQTY